MTKKCSVPGCGATHKTNGAVFYRFATTLSSMPILSLQRSQKWIEALGFRETFNTNSKVICNKHFVSGKLILNAIYAALSHSSLLIGKPAKLTDVKDADWIPSVDVPVQQTGNNLNLSDPSGVTEQIEDSSIQFQISSSDTQTLVENTINQRSNTLDLNEASDYTNEAHSSVLEGKNMLIGL